MPRSSAQAQMRPRPMRPSSHSMPLATGSRMSAHNVPLRGWTWATLDSAMSSGHRLPPSSMGATGNWKHARVSARNRPWMPQRERISQGHAWSRLGTAAAMPLLAKQGMGASPCSEMPACRAMGSTEMMLFRSCLPLAK
eukprot:3509576-Pyramimonas_sp.AAC.1